VPRILHAGGDATGEHIELTLSRKVRNSGIQILEDCLVTDVLVDNRSVQGVKALDCRTGSTEEYGCRFLILASGGAGRLFKYNTNSDIATGDGIVLAFRAGAEIGDIEFFQFHPTALRLPGVPPFLISEAVRGEGGILRNVEGYQFMPDYAPEAELAPRDIVARSIVYEMRKTHSERAFIDVTHLPPRQVTTRFPQIYRFCMEHGLDITKGLIPVAPAAHYMIGGVKTNMWGETGIKGLFAAGEVACTGVHGANRLASNSMVEVVVYAKRIIERTRECVAVYSSGSPEGDGDYCMLPQRPSPKKGPALSLSALQALMWENVGIVRSRESLEDAAAILATWEGSLGSPTDRLSYELNSLVVTGRLVAEAALVREESRGAHFRSDFPESSDQWLRHLVFKGE
jgi:L-aspartate oxidase